MRFTLLRDLQSSPLTLIRRHSYSSLGKHTAWLTVANALGRQPVSRIVSVERNLRTASVKATSVKLLGQPTTFTFTVDPTLTPAMPVAVLLDYDDGTSETVTLGEMRDRAVALSHSHTYARSVSSPTCLYAECKRCSQLHGLSSHGAPVIFVTT